MPLLFVHGFSQSTTAWERQFAGPLGNKYRLVRFDLRGHGGSDKPSDASAYTESQKWSADIDAIIRELGLDRPVLIGWSYGGYVISDYLREFGSEKIRGIVLVGGATKKGGVDARPFSGRPAAPLWKDLFDDDEAVWRPGLATFAEITTVKPIDADWRARILARNGQTPSFVRRALMDRTLDNDDVLAATTVPALIIHGADDGVVTPLAAEHHARLLPHSRLVIYEETGHMPFAEQPDRFDADLDAFVSALPYPGASARPSTVLTRVLNR